MTDGDHEGCDYDHRTLEDHEARLVVGDATPKAALEFDDTVRRTNEDEDCRDKKSCHEVDISDRFI